VYETPADFRHPAGAWATGPYPSIDGPQLEQPERRFDRDRSSISLMAEICGCCSNSVDWWVKLRSHPDLPICHDCLGGLNGQRDGQLQLMKGKWIATGFESIFKVANVARSVAWFERAGFETSYHDDTYAFAHRDRDLTIHLAQADEDELPGHGVLYIHCQDAGRAAEEWKEAGIEVDGPRDEDYGKQEGSIKDPDGNLIRFGSPIR
jgi:catechol 2,3-dioxygenase-like lactoylglutathione lyase family enzyme